MTARLPIRLRRLEDFVELWALPTENARSRQRWRASPAEFQAFYEAMMAVVEDVLRYLDRHPVGEIPDSDKPLYLLAVAFAEIAPHVELYRGSAEVPHSFAASRFTATHGNVEH